jgi:hypothetical protein
LHKKFLLALIFGLTKYYLNRVTESGVLQIPTVTARRDNDVDLSEPYKTTKKTIVNPYFCPNPLNPSISLLIISTTRGNSLGQ